MLRPIRFTMLAASLVLALALAGCGGNRAENAGGEGEMTSDTATMPMAGAPASDGEIAAIVRAVNQADIDNGNLAQDKSSNADVDAFARQMVNDHSASNKNLDAVAQKLNMQIQESRMTNDLKATTDAKRDSLRDLDGAAFDRAYAESEVALHQQVLNDLDNTLIPNAQSEDMKTLLQQTRTAVEGHLRMAQELQSKLGTTSSRY